MKLMTRLLLVLVFSIALAIPIQAQNPAVRMTQGPTKESVKFTLKNLKPAAIAVGIVELQIFDQATCRRLCATRRAINQRIAPCQTLDSEIRCQTQVPQVAGYIYFLRVRSTSGALLTEDWLFVP